MHQLPQAWHRLATGETNTFCPMRREILQPKVALCAEPKWPFRPLRIAPTLVSFIRPMDADRIY